MSHLYVASSKICSSCGGEVDGFKCPKCGEETKQYDPNHWRKCHKEGRLKLKCKSCGKSEIDCRCQK